MEVSLNKAHRTKKIFYISVLLFVVNVFTMDNQENDKKWLYERYEINLEAYKGHPDYKRVTFRATCSKNNVYNYKDDEAIIVSKDTCGEFSGIKKLIPPQSEHYIKLTNSECKVYFSRFKVLFKEQQKKSEEEKK